MNLNRIPHRIRSRPIVTVLAAGIELMQSCADLGIPDKADRRFLVSSSFHANEDHAAFDDVLSFKVLP